MPSAHKVSEIDVVSSPGFDDYELLDCGNGRKLERFGKVVVDRPEPQALWQPRLVKRAWAAADAVFSASGEDDEKGRWRVDRPVPESWPVKIPVAVAGGGKSAVTVLCKLSGLWHLGLFPEQQAHWSWMAERLAGPSSEPPRVLNLFGYTGAASLIAASLGAEVTHVDASKKAVAWGRENQSASNMNAAKIRWIVDDAAKFTAREVRRGRTYNIILVDPPKFGRGPDGEVWDLFAHLPALLKDLEKLLDPKGSAMVLTVYAIRASALAFARLMSDTLSERGGVLSCGELAIKCSMGTILPTSLYVRWSSGA